MKKINIAMIISLLSIIIISTTVYINNYNKVKYEKERQILLDEIEKNKISKNEKDLLALKKFNDQTKEEITIINKKIDDFSRTLTVKGLVQKCIELQMDRIINGKQFEVEYCKKKIQEKEEIKEIQAEEKPPIKIEPKPTVQKKVTIPEPKIVKKADIKIERSNLFMCREINEKFGLSSDIYRCATYMSMVKTFESDYGKSAKCINNNNCFGLRIPTDKKGLVGSWSIGKGNFLIFETREFGKHAFAYYYQKYHTTKNASRFVNTYSDGNQNYKIFLIGNYDWIYSEYKNI